MTLLSLPIMTHSVAGTGPRSIHAVRVLRISLTDRCNFRCVYCMPSEGVAWLPKSEILSFEEICQIVRAAIEVHGITRFKLTGGEPTMRAGLIDLVEMLRSIDGIEDLSLTSNGQLLDKLARPLRDAGIDRVTVSLDSLRPDRFRLITRTGSLEAVWRGIEACEAAGFDNLKINCVAMRGTNDDEFADFARLTLNRRLTVRFIEYMPLGHSALVPDESAVVDHPGPAEGCGAQYRGPDAFVSEEEIRAEIEARLGPLTPVDRAGESGVGPAKVYRLALGKPRGRIGFISAMSKPFCDTCNRLRLTADGKLRSCLFEGGEVDVRPILRGGVFGDVRQRLAEAMAQCVQMKPKVHGVWGREQMSRIGG